MTNGAEPRVRRDVQSLVAEGPSGMKVLEDYATAITAMRAIDRKAGKGDPKDPRSWRFQAAIHGFPGLTPSLTDKRRWSSCRHNSWFFLPWHRVYLYYFESMIQHHLGDPEWSLPYWDYTKVGDAESQKIPAPFRTPTKGNALYTPERDAAFNDESDPQVLPFEICDAREALAFADFALDGEDPAQSFGGGVVKDVTPNQRARGSMELTPHGLVHGYVGGESGLMAQFSTAGLDPLFWLHHCNLDRLWDVWIAKWGADRLPQDREWLKTRFRFFGSDGKSAGKRVEEVLATADLGYAYESIDQPEGTPGPDPLSELAAPAPAPRVPAELLGGTRAVSFSSRAAVDVELTATERVASALAGDESVSPRWFLRVEDIAGSAPKAPGYAIYLDLPDGAAPADHPQLRAGIVASFGVPEASDPASEHGGAGLTDTFEITGVIATIAAGAADFDASTVTVHVVPVGAAGELDDGGDVQAGRISIYAG
jgi:tyrosinase